MNPKNVAILGSGAGSSAEAIIKRSMLQGARFRVAFVASTKADAGILQVAGKLGTPAFYLPYGEDSSGFSEALIQNLVRSKVEILVLAGFMRLLPESVIEALNGRVINTHPALLPKYGGKGMFGRKVHEAVLASGDTVSGATVHWVTKQYDEGAVIDQVTVPVKAADTVKSLQQRVKEAERELLVEVVEGLCGIVP